MGGDGNCGDPENGTLRLAGESGWDGNDSYLSVGFSSLSKLRAALGPLFKQYIRKLHIWAGRLSAAQFGQVVHLPYSLHETWKLVEEVGSPWLCVVLFAFC